MYILKALSHQEYFWWFWITSNRLAFILAAQTLDLQLYWLKIQIKKKKVQPNLLACFLLKVTLTH